MNTDEIIAYVKDAILLMERIQKDNNALEDILMRSLQNIKQHNEEIKSTQNQLHLVQNMLNNYPTNTSEATVNQPLNKSKIATESKQNEPMTVRDAIAYLRKSHVYLSDYGYYISGSFETRYNALKKAMNDYPMDSILQKLRALIIVWSQNAVNQIKSAETYVNHLRADFHTLKEEELLVNKSNCS